MRVWVAAVLSVGLCVGNGFAAEKPKVFITGQNSFQAQSSEGEQQVSGVGGPVEAEGIKRFQDCSACTVTMRRDKADYIVSLTDDGSGAGRKGRRVVVFRPSGDLVLAESVRALGNAIKDACKAIEKDWNAKH